MITKSMLDQLRAERIQNNARLDYTPDGPVHTRVVSTLEAEREKKILQGERALHDALHHMWRERTYASHLGLARTHFNQSNKEIKP